MSAKDEASGIVCYHSSTHPTLRPCLDCIAAAIEQVREEHHDSCAVCSLAVEQVREEARRAIEQAEARGRDTGLEEAAKLSEERLHRIVEELRKKFSNETLVAALTIAADADAIRSLKRDGRVICDECGHDSHGSTGCNKPLSDMPMDADYCPCKKRGGRE